MSIVAYKSLQVLDDEGTLQPVPLAFNDNFQYIADYGLPGGISLSATKTDTYNVATTDGNKTLIMNSTSNKIFNLPAVDASNIGLTFTFIKINTGNVTIQTDTGDVIMDSSAGGTIANTSATETYASIALRLVTASKWTIVGGIGTWTTA